MKRGFEINPRPPPDETAGKGKKRGLPKKTPPLNLLMRLQDCKLRTLAFMRGFRVPFDNNGGEWVCA